MASIGGEEYEDEEYEDEEEEEGEEEDEKPRSTGQAGISTETDSSRVSLVPLHSLIGS